MKQYDVVIIGGGLGGLESGLILSKEGMKVCVLEQHHTIGGNLQSFSRDGRIFDTGMHYFGCMGEGEYLHKYMTYFGITDKIKLKQLDTDSFEVLSFGEEETEYACSQGWKNYLSGLITQFPDEKNAIRAYSNEVKKIASDFPLYSSGVVSSFKIPMETLRACAVEVLNRNTVNNRLKNILAGSLSLYPGKAEKTPFYIHAMMRDSLITSCWRPVDGSQQIADSLAQRIQENGGDVFTSHKVEEFIIENDLSKAVLLSNGEKVFGSYFISNVHPATTMSMIPEGKIRKFYRKRITGLENTCGAFIVYAVLKKGSFPYLNKNYFHYENGGVLMPRGDVWPDNYYFYTPASSHPDEYADSFMVMADMEFDDVSKWSGTRFNKRGESYEDFKASRAERLLLLLEKRFPGIRSAILKTYTSTPLTFRDYTGTHEGSAYGILKDCHDPLRSIILPRTKISNLLFTGQNLNLHGMMGVTAGSVITCSEILGLEYLTNKINNG
ncbi:MAG: NAD(P)-binding protein [Bacteroidales bacterium]|jgi:all-trans-retinol 13,14-reductase|nr:NAD(P)-binding protein [Bacteroidales bacterium]